MDRDSIVDMFGFTSWAELYEEFAGMTYAELTRELLGDEDVVDMIWEFLIEDELEGYNKDDVND